MVEYVGVSCWGSSHLAQPSVVVVVAPAPFRVPPRRRVQKTFSLALNPLGWTCVFHTHKKQKPRKNSEDLKRTAAQVEPETQSSP
jgi:hypothetical protein